MSHSQNADQSSTPAYKYLQRHSPEICTPVFQMTNEQYVSPIDTKNNAINNSFNSIADNSLSNKKDINQVQNSNAQNTSKLKNMKGSPNNKLSSYSNKISINLNSSLYPSNRNSAFTHLSGNVTNLRKNNDPDIVTSTMNTSNNQSENLSNKKYANKSKHFSKSNDLHRELHSDSESQEGEISY